jgi:non-specific protein-tyrosine kinase
MAAATVIVAVAAGVTSSLRTDLYTAGARVLLRPGDTAEQLYADRATASRGAVDADRYLAGQLDIIESEPVAVAAAKLLDGASPKDLLAQVSASQSGATDVVEISATDPDPARAAKVANAFTRAYVENRRDYAVGGLDRVAAELEGKLAELQDRIGDLDAKVIDGQAPADVEAARQAAAVQYETLYARQQELLVTKSLKRGEAELIAQAEAPGAPASPKPKRDAALGAIIGLLLGLGFAFLREQLDDRVRTREEVEQVTGLAVLAELPTDEESERNPAQVAAAERPVGALAEAARGLRTSITFLGVDEPLRRIVVTSPGPGEGKSMVAANLAAVYAQAGKKAILVSADLRRPRIESIFRIDPCPGLSDVIAGLAQSRSPSTNGSSARPSGGADSFGLPGVLRPTGIDGLMVLPTGRIPPNPAELLASARAEEVLDALNGLADVVVVDTPPVLAVTDAAVLAARADGVVIVASADGTHRGALARTRETLAATHSRLLGVVLNKLDAGGGGSYYGYGRYYGKYYGSHYGQKPEKTSRWRRNKSGAEVTEGAGR